MASTEYRVVYVRDGRTQYRDGFRHKDIEWGSYFHDIREHEVIGWEERIIGDWKKSDD